jgi:mRNA interferase HicA
MGGAMNASQFERYLKKEHDIECHNKKGTGHKLLRNPANSMTSELPVHGGSKELGAKLVNKIMKELGLK